MTENDIKHKILEHEKECRDSSLKELRELVTNGFKEVRHLTDMNARANAENSQIIAAINERLEAGVATFRDIKQHQERLEIGAKETAVKMAYLVGYMVGAGLIGGGIVTFLAR